MKYFHYLDLDWKPVSEKLKEFVLNNKVLLDYDNTGWKKVELYHLRHLLPDIITMLKPLNVIPTRISFHITYQSDNKIHKDATDHDCRRILIPIMNCENSVTRFYKSAQEPVLQHQTDGIPYYGNIDSDTCACVDEYYLDRPVAMRPKELHAVYTSNTSFPRISCPVNVNNDLTYLLQ
jgi:hypothetical protein